MVNKIDTSEIDNEISQLGKIVQEKDKIIETLQKQFDALKEDVQSFAISLKEKDDKVKHLEEGMDFLVQYFEKDRVHIYPNVYCEKCKTNIRMPTIFYLPDHMEKVHRVFKCEKCEFTAESDRARKYHIKSEHK